MQSKKRDARLGVSFFAVLKMFRTTQCHCERRRRVAIRFLAKKPLLFFDTETYFLLSQYASNSGVLLQYALPQCSKSHRGS